MRPTKELKDKGSHDVDAKRVSLPNDDVTKNFDILVLVAMHYGKTFIPPRLKLWCWRRLLWPQVKVRISCKFETCAVPYFKWHPTVRSNLTWNCHDLPLGGLTASPKLFFSKYARFDFKRNVWTKWKLCRRSENSYDIEMLQIDSSF